MKIAVTSLILGLMACLAPSIGATPPPWSAKAQLPEQASEHAQPPSKLAEIVPTVPIQPPPVLPAIIAAFTSGQSSSSVAAQAAIESSTTVVRTKLSSSSTVSIITMTGNRLSRFVTRLRPLGRSGDLEESRWTFNDRFGRRIGSGNLLCRWATSFRRLCWGEARLPRGRLVMLGSSQTTILGEFAVVGGTGVYLFKQGLLTFKQLGAKKYAIRILLA